MLRVFKVIGVNSISFQKLFSGINSLTYEKQIYEQGISKSNLSPTTMNLLVFPKEWTFNQQRNYPGLTVSPSGQYGKT